MKMAKLAIRGGKSVRSKPFSSWPLWNEKEQTELLKVLKSGNWSYHARKHEKQGEFAERFARFHDAKYGICTNSGAAALEVSLRAAGVKPNDEVIVPALTFTATASAALLIGAVPVFVDVDPDSYCIDVGKFKDAISQKTRAVIPVHLYCNIANMDEIMAIANKNDLVVVEDCAHAHGSQWRGKGIGSIGTLGCFSFQQTKIMTAGEGGIITTNDEKLEEFCTSLVDCGRVRKDDKYAQNTLGWNYRMTEFQAAVLLGQLERLPDQLLKREKNAGYLSSQLAKVEGIKPPVKDGRVTRQSYYYYIMKYCQNSFENVPRNRFMAALYFEGIPCEPIYEPVYQSPLFTLERGKWPLISGTDSTQVDYSSVKCPIAEKASYEEAVAIPHTVLLGQKEDIEDVVAAVEKIKENASELYKTDSAAFKAFRAFRRHAPEALRHPRNIGKIIDELRD
jgi:dTDP-4-amino-4,6-dideoxygalactose transaminase